MSDLDENEDSRLLELEYPVELSKLLLDEVENTEELNSVEEELPEGEEEPTAGRSTSKKKIEFSPLARRVLLKFLFRGVISHHSLIGSALSLRRRGGFCFFSA